MFGSILFLRKMFAFDLLFIFLAEGGVAVGLLEELVNPSISNAAF